MLFRCPSIVLAAICITASVSASHSGAFVQHNALGQPNQPTVNYAHLTPGGRRLMADRGQVQKFLKESYMSSWVDKKSKHGTVRLPQDALTKGSRLAEEYALKQMEHGNMSLEDFNRLHSCFLANKRLREVEQIENFRNMYTQTLQQVKKRYPDAEERNITDVAFLTALTTIYTELDEYYTCLSNEWKQELLEKMHKEKMHKEQSHKEAASEEDKSETAWQHAKVNMFRQLVSSLAPVDATLP